jgi:hypothetical protein
MHLAAVLAAAPSARSVGRVLLPAGALNFGDAQN